jgi:hypothetical protein
VPGVAHLHRPDVLGREGHGRVEAVGQRRTSGSSSSSGVSGSGWARSLQVSGGSLLWVRVGALTRGSAGGGSPRARGQTGHQQRGGDVALDQLRHPSSDQSPRSRKILRDRPPWPIRMGGERRVQKQRKLGGAMLLLVCTVAACTRVRQQTDPLPARPLPSIPHSNEPTRRPWPVTTIRRRHRASRRGSDRHSRYFERRSEGPQARRHQQRTSTGAFRRWRRAFRAPGRPPSAWPSTRSPIGRASNIKVSGASPDGERCVSATLARTKLPVFEGKSVPVAFPISVFRPAGPHARRGRREHAAPAARSAGAARVAPPAGSSNAPYVPSSMAPTTAPKPVTTRSGRSFQP